MSLLEWCAGVGSALASLLFFWLSRTDNYAHPVFRLTSWVSKVAFYFSPYLQLTISEYGAERFQRSEFFLAVEAYLSEACAHRARKLKADIGRDCKNIQVYVDDKEEVIDTYRGATIWWHACKKQPRNTVISFYHGQEESRFYQVVFHRRHRDLVIRDYLPYVLSEGRAATIQNRPRRLFTNKPSSRWQSHRENAVWSHVAFQHPATFNTLAMDPDQKEAIIDDLEAFREAEDYYTKVGKAWKRGYLLYGPPGTGKSTMIAAMANFLNYDVYDLELTAVKNNTELRKLFIETKSKSIIVIEDMDCSVDLTGMRKDKKSDDEGDKNPMQLIDPEKDERTRMTLSGVLNFIDGLWSACGGERILIFTTNNKDKLDPALIRRGRMDMHIEMSYCRFEAFRVLARNFLDVEEHELFGEIQRLLEETDVSPADVAENLMPMSRKNRRNPDACLAGLVEALKKAKEVAKVKMSQESADAAKPGDMSWEEVDEKKVDRPRTGHDKTAMGSPSLVQADNDEWVLDTRSWIHHTPNLQLLHDLTTNQDVAHERGSVHTERFKVPDVRYIPGDARNVISVAQLARRGFVTVFEPTRAYVRDPATEKDIGMARVRDCVYVLDCLLISPPHAQQDSADATPADKLQGLDCSRPQLERPEKDGWFGMSTLHRANDPSPDVFLTLLHDEQHQRTRTGQFYMDSGSSHHMTWNRDVLRPYHADIQTEPPMQSVTRFVQSPPLAVDGIWYVDSKGGSLDRVLFVPDSKVNLVSISQLTQDCSVRVVFHQDTFWIDRLESKEMTGHGYRVGVNYVVARLDVGAATDWVLDSFSWYHHTPNRQMIMCHIQDRTGRDLPAAGEDREEGLQIHGSVRTERFNIQGVRCIAGDTRNVISVAQLAYGHGLVTVFEPTRCHVKNKETGKIFGRGLLRNGIYVLEYLRTGQEKVGGQEAAGGGGSGAGDGDRGHGGGRSAGGGNEGQGNSGGGGESGRGGQADGGNGGTGGGGEKEGKKEEDEGCEGEEEEEQEEEKEETDEESSFDEESVQEEEKGGERVERKAELDESSKLQAATKMFGLHRFDRPTDPTALLPRVAFPTLTNQQRNRMFIVDTGACFHSTWDESILSRYPGHLSRGIQRPITCFSGVSGSTEDGLGSVQVTDYGYLNYTDMRLDGVLLAPNSQMNLLCVGQLLHQYGVTVEFGLEEVIFKGRDGSQVGRACMHLESHHYVLEYFLPKFLYADIPTPHQNIFGKSCFGPRQQ